ncbi:hypothetical protein KIN20_024428 [Parelaphostrongylus tenuis]|uniref:Uncharacterized protein n=1 Tax=Parelaphostrongylus tenuis TaxID=148309 RepID=A0AAD5QXL6_PARTN|nr:hypothetical protein KIN20_024428 [Parelaphostrongylus tenuis]
MRFIESRTFELLRYVPERYSRLVEDALSLRQKIALMRQKVTQMVHDPREQVLQQRFEDLRRNGPSGVGGTQLPPTSTGSSIDGHHPNGRLTSPGPPHLISLPTHYCSPHIVSLSCN